MHSIIYIPLKEAEKYKKCLHKQKLLNEINPQALMEQYLNASTISSSSSSRTRSLSSSSSSSSRSFSFSSTSSCSSLSSYTSSSSSSISSCSSSSSSSCCHNSNCSLNKPQKSSNSF